MPNPADTAVNAERKDEDADPFPPEGTDEKIVRPNNEPWDDRPLTEDEAVKATQKALKTPI
jgi:hypothetical protein